MNRLAIFASGNGSNAQRIIEYFRGHPTVSVALVLCNKPGAGVLDRAAGLGVPAKVFTREELYETGAVRKLLQQEEIGYLILAGFLWLVPGDLIALYRDRILNIHPALLPRHGGKGMYGMRVHEAVIAAGEKSAGITIHLVNERYDEGNILFQASCQVTPEDTAESLAHKIHELEYDHYPRVIGETVTRDT